MNSHHAFAPRTLLLVALLVSTSLFGCSQRPADEPDASAEQSQSLTQWLDEQYEQELQLSPIGLTFLGRKDRNDEIDELTYEAFAEQLAWKTASVEELRARFDRDQLTDDERLSYDLWIYQLEEMQATEPFFYDD
ncbi:MAG TPA: hypothetical protein DE147_10885, partial [Gammaproteobacteria bacterium]|nr:hypothetical protein [Gammaproteobacteria bacterium]